MIATMTIAMERAERAVIAAKDDILAGYGVVPIAPAAAATTPKKRPESAASTFRTPGNVTGDPAASPVRDATPNRRANAAKGKLHGTSPDKPVNWKVNLPAEDPNDYSAPFSAKDSGLTVEERRRLPTPAGMKLKPLKHRSKDSAVATSPLSESHRSPASKRAMEDVALSHVSLRL